MNRRRIRHGLSLLLLALLSGLGARAQSNPRELRLLNRIPLPAAHSVAEDIRWASDDSVYISRDRDGVFEVGLDGARRRTLIPDLKTLGGGINNYQYLAISPTTLAVASLNWGIAWRSLKGSPDGTIKVQSQAVPIVNSLDLSGDRILLMGVADRNEDKDRRPRFAFNGDVAWIGTLSDRLKDLKPVLYDVGGAGAPNYFNCRTRLMGAVRFLAGGSFVIAPGFQDGIHLYDAGGREVRTWRNEQVGIDTHSDCHRMSYQDQERLASEAGWGPWLNSHHVLDDILPLPQGPGLLVRSWGPDGAAHWTLKVLQPDGGVKTYAVPVVGRRPFDRLRGDVRNGKIVFLMAPGFPWSWDPANFPAEMLLMSLPND
jgi:hypothetical protein